MKSTVIAIDLAKDVFEVAVSRVPGKVAERHRFSRQQLIEWISKAPPAKVLLEACGSAHDWARRIRGFGHEVRLIPPHIVPPYVMRNKTDRTDVKGLLEAERNEEIHPVPIKSEAIQGLAGLHRIRSGWMGTRTARINEVRGLLREFGITIPKGADRFLERASAALRSETTVPQPLREQLLLILEEVVELDRSLEGVDKAIRSVGSELADLPLLCSVPGIGTLTATAAYTSIVDPHRFRHGRQMSSSVGMTPREHSSGGHRWLGRITKRGDRYLRTLITHGARSVLIAAKRKKTPTRLEAWALDRERAIGHNKASIALGNKMLRILWAVWTRGVPYRAEPA
jgi:transposase